MTDPQPVFIYGTLKRGHVRAPLLRGQTCLGFARTRPVYRLFDLGPFPALIEVSRLPASDAGAHIEGEVWAVDAQCLARLDEEEGVHEGLYERKRIELADDAPCDDAVEAYFYRGELNGARDCGARWPTDETSTAGASQ